MAISLDLLNFVKMLFKSLTRVSCVVPSLCLIDYCHNGLILDHDANVDGVVHVSEDSALVRVANIDILQ